MSIKKIKIEIKMEIKKKNVNLIKKTSKLIL